MTRLFAQLSALLALVWLALQLGREAPLDRAVMTAAIVGMATYVAGLGVLAAVRVVRGAPPAAPGSDEPTTA